jgi:hypothetical protein
MKGRYIVFAIFAVLLIACGDSPEASKNGSQVPSDSDQKMAASAEDRDKEHSNFDSAVIKADSMRSLSRKTFNAMKAEGSIPSDLVRIRSLDRLEEYVEVQYGTSEKPSFDSVFSNRKIFVDPDEESALLQVHASGGTE